MEEKNKVEPKSEFWLLMGIIIGVLMVLSGGVFLLKGGYESKTHGWIITNVLYSEIGIGLIIAMFIIGLGATIVFIFRSRKEEVQAC